MNGSIKLAIVATHPIQYHIPWYRGIAAGGEVSLKVYYAVLPDSNQQGIGFGVPFNWDVPLLDGYRWELLQNAAKNPGIGTFAGCDVPNIGDCFRRDRPDAVLLTGWHSKVLLQALWAARRLRIPCIVRGESNVLRSRASWKKWLHRLLLRGYDRFLAIGQSNREFYRLAGVPLERIHDCKYFIDNGRFAGEAEKLRGKRAALREKWAIPPHSTCFLYAGKLEPKKRILDLLGALAKAMDSGTACHLLVVGDGELMAAAKETTATKNLPATFAGFLNQTQIVEAYVAADCLVLPSDDGETWGLVVNEAMACGLAAIVSDRVGCGPDLIEAGVTGSTYPMGNVGALADKLVEFAADRKKLRAMGLNAQQRVFEFYSLEQAVRATLDAVTAAIKDR
jgi:glycosyltransferase involved in cell wall biosynthesis